MAPVALVLYTRHGCPLCDEMEEVVRNTLPRDAYTLTMVDVDSDRALQDRYGLVLPVLAIDGRDAFETRVDPAALRSRVGAARPRR